MRRGHQLTRAVRALPAGASSGYRARRSLASNPNRALRPLPVPIVRRACKVLARVAGSRLLATRDLNQSETVEERSESSAPCRDVGPSACIGQQPCSGDDLHGRVATVLFPITGREVSSPTGWPSLRRKSSSNSRLATPCFESCGARAFAVARISSLPIRLPDWLIVNRQPRPLHRQHSTQRRRLQANLRTTWPSLRADDRGPHRSSSAVAHPRLA